MNNAIPNITLIKAGAGAGKTHRIQSTLTDWVKQGSVRADRILAVTFTNAATNEMSQRIKLALLNAGQTEQAALLQQSVISSIHSFALSILQRFAFEEGLSPAPEQLSESEEKYLLADVLSQLESVVAMVDDADRFGYKGKGGGVEYKDKHQLIQAIILRVIGTLRSIGKDSLVRQSVDPKKVISQTLEQTQKALQEAYGETDDEKTLNAALKTAVENVRTEFKSKDNLQAWGTNSATRSFVETLFSIDLDNITGDWTKWLNLQTASPAGGIYGTKKAPGEPAHIALAEAVWKAADQLHSHPGPLQDAQDHIKQLLTIAFEASERYQETKRDAGLVDYADMVSLAHTMLHNDDWLKELADQFDCVIIDEFQDTNPLQYAMLYRLHEQGVPVFIVGDLKQAIMGFQGADSRLFAGLLKQHAADSDVVQELPNNWRSTAELMTFINAMGTQLYADEYSPLNPQVTATSDLLPVRIMYFAHENWLSKAHATSKKPLFGREGYQILANQIVELLEPADGTVTQIIDKHSGQKRAIRPSDIAVLAKTHNRLASFAKVLRASGINVQIQQEGFLQCPAVSLLLDALQALNHPNDQFAWAVLITSPLLTDQPAEELKALLESALNNLQNSEKVSWQKQFEHPLKTSLPEACKYITQQSVLHQLQAIIQALDLLDIIKDFPDYAQYRANILKLQKLAEQFEQQAELSLNVIGVVGKNASSFQAWLQANASVINTQPLANPVADDALVLSTWHKSKGLEWPIVMVLQAEDAPETRLPSIAVEFQQSEGQGIRSADDLIDNSTIQILHSFADKQSTEKMLAMRQSDTDTTAKNLYYVAITRAREQLIIPVLESDSTKTDEKKGKLYHYLLPVATQLIADESSVVTLEKITATIDGVTQCVLTKTIENRSVKIKTATAENAQKKSLKHTITPSQHKEDEQLELLDKEVAEEVTEQTYGKGFDLNTLGYTGQANELGTWMHRIYQVYLLAPKQPELLKRALTMQPCPVQDPTIVQALQEHLQSFRASLETLTGGVKQMLCEVPVTGLNHNDQVISGVIDLLVESESGEWWIIDHKTDQEAVSKGYWEQLQAYTNILQKSRTVVGSVLHWTREEKLSVLR